MTEIYETLGAVLFGGLTVYGFFWNQGRAKKADEAAIFTTIRSENEKQNKETDKHSDQQHKRIGDIIVDLNGVQFELGFTKGFREGDKFGRAEVRAQINQGK